MHHTGDKIDCEDEKEKEVTARPGAEAALQAGGDIHHIMRHTEPPETSSRRTKIHHRFT